MLVTVTCTGAAVLSLMLFFHTDATKASGEVAAVLTLNVTCGVWREEMIVVGTMIVSNIR